MRRRSQRLYRRTSSGDLCAGRSGLLIISLTTAAAGRRRCPIRPARCSPTALIAAASAARRCVAVAVRTSISRHPTSAATPPLIPLSSQQKAPAAKASGFRRVPQPLTACPRRSAPLTGRIGPVFGRLAVVAETLHCRAGEVPEEILIVLGKVIHPVAHHTLARQHRT